jgi:hypothetical protein
MKIALLLAVCACVAATAATPLFRLSEPATWAELDVDKVKGRPAQLAWSDDENTLYLQVVDGTTPDTIKYRHYLIEKGGAPAAVDRQPAWAQTYWKWKSAKRFFGDPVLTIEVDTTRELVDDLRDRHTAYLNSEKKAPATLESKQAGEARVRHRLMLKGHIVGDFVDEEIFPGYTFSWSPEALRMIAFRSPDGRLTIMNAEGETEVAGNAKDVWLPSWSESGDRIAYLERSGRKKFTLRVMTAL